MKTAIYIAGFVLYVLVAGVIVGFCLVLGAVTGSLWLIAGAIAIAVVLAALGAGLLHEWFSRWFL